MAEGTPAHFFSKQLGGEEPLTFETARLLAVGSRRLFEIAPWEYLSEDQLLFVEDEAYPDPHVCTVMGAGGEAAGLLVFPGKEGYNFLRRVHSGEMQDSGDYLAGNRSLTVHYNPKRAVSAADKQMLKAVGYKSKSGELIPEFRSLRPGYLPWFINQSEGLTLNLCVAAMLELLDHVNTDPDANPWPDDRTYPLITKTGIESYQPSVEPEPLPRPGAFDGEQLRKLMAVGTKSAGAIEVDFMTVPVAVGAQDERPAALRMAISADAQSGFAYPPEAVGPETYEGDALTAAVLGAIKSAKGVPGIIFVRNAEHQAMLRALAQEIGATLKVSRELPAVSSLKSSLRAHFGG